MDRTTFAIVTDAHFGQDNAALGLGTLGSQGPDVLELFTRRIRFSRPAFIFSLGDHVKDAKKSEDLGHMREYRRILNESSIPSYHAVGNHDLVRLTDKEAAKALGMPSLYYTFDTGHVRCIVLAPSSRKVKRTKNDVTMDEKQVAWLRKELERSTKPIVVFSHYPLHEPNLCKCRYWFYFVPHPWRAVIKNRKELRSMFEKSGKVIAVFSGHLHNREMQTINGIPYYIVPALTENKNGSPAGDYALVSVWGRHAFVRNKSVGIYYKLKK